MEEVQVTEYLSKLDICESVGPNGIVQVSAGIGSIFFLVAGTVLCFGFSVRMMLITC